MILRFDAALFMAGLVACAEIASAQNYPSKPVRVVTSEAGGGVDTVMRLIAPALISSLGQNVIIENRPSALIGDMVARAQPDGYTLLIAGPPFMLGPFLQKVSYDPVKDFAPVSLVGRGPNILVVHPSVAAHAVKDLIALAKAKPGALNYAAGGTGSSNHLAAELFKSMAGVDIVRVQYKGAGPAVNAVIGGETQLMFPAAFAATTHVKSGRLRGLAVTSAQPSELAPGLPTVAASGLPGYESALMVGMFAPVKTPPAIVNKLNQEIAGVAKRSEVKERLLNAGVEGVGSSPAEFAAAIKADMLRTGKVIKEAGIRVE